MFGTFEDAIKKSDRPKTLNIRLAIDGLRQSSKTYVKSCNGVLVPHYNFLKSHFEFRFTRPGDHVFIDTYVEGAKLHCYNPNQALFLKEHITEKYPSCIHEEFSIVNGLEKVKHVECPACHEQHPLIMKRDWSGNRNDSIWRKPVYLITYFVICPTKKQIETFYGPQEYSEPDHCGLG